MCEFFSFISNGYGKYFYFDNELRKKINNGEFLGLDLNADSHSSIFYYFQKIGKLTKSEDKCNKYEWCPITEDFTVDQINTKDDSEAAEKWVNNRLDFSTIVPELIRKNVFHPFLDSVRKDVTKKDIKLLKEHVLNPIKFGSLPKVLYYAILNQRKSKNIAFLNKTNSVYHIKKLIDTVLYDEIIDKITDSFEEYNILDVNFDNSINAVFDTYIASFFKLDKWVEYGDGSFPAQSLLELWHRGLIPVFYNEFWRFHGGKDGKVLYEIKEEDLLRK